MLFTAGLYSSRAKRLWEPVTGADWEHIRVYWHTRSTHHHQLPARSAVQVQLQLPAGIPGQQHTAGLVSLTHIIIPLKSVWMCSCGVLQKASKPRIDIWWGKGHEGTFWGDGQNATTNCDMYCQHCNRPETNMAFVKKTCCLVLVDCLREVLINLCGHFWGCTFSLS